MLFQPLDFLAGFTFSVVLGGLAYMQKSLSLSGLICALAIGTSLYGFGGWQPFLLFVLFFVSTSILTRFRYQKKAKMGAAEPRGGARSIWQGVGQGGVACIVAFIAALYTSSWSPLMLSLISSIGEANADGWAAEIGVLSKRMPRLITRLSKEVPPGTSGGVSLLGETTAFLGSIFIASLGVATGMGGEAVPVALLVCIVSAILGEHIDSVLGATVQAVYYCPECQKETEQKIHGCGTRCKHRRGISFVSNEFVNFIATGSAAVLSVVLYIVFF
jgi:uncharacterized protein (TIGR00297 family)